MTLEEHIATLPDQFKGLPDAARSVAGGVCKALLEAGEASETCNAAAWTVVQKLYNQDYDSGAWSRRTDDDMWYSLGQGRFAGCVSLSADAVTEVGNKREFVTWEGSQYVKGKPIQITLEGVFTNKDDADGPLDFSAEKLKQALANNATYRPHVALDFGHASTEYGTGEEGKAAAWLLAENMEHVPGKGLFCSPLYTITAADAIEKGEWKFVSPVWAANAIDPHTPGERIGPLLYAAALTNVPFQTGLAPISLSQKSSPARPATGEPNMKTLLTALSAKDEADAVTKLDAMTKAGEAAASAVTAVALALGLSDGKDTKAVIAKAAEFKAALAAKDSEVTTLSARVKGLEEKDMKREAELAVDTLIGKGRAIPAQRDALVSLATKDRPTFDALAAVAPEVVPQGVRGAASPEGSGEPSIQAGGDEQKAEVALVGAVAEVAGENKLKASEVWKQLDAFAKTKAAHAAYVKATGTRS